MNDLLLHVGYPKAGSSTLQRSFLNGHRYFSLIARMSLPRTDTEEAFLKYIIYADGTEFREARAQELLSGITRSEHRTNESIQVISEETFTASGVYADRSLVAQRMRSLVDGAKVLILIRNQFDIIRSRYEHCPYDIFGQCSSTAAKPIKIDAWLDENLNQWYGTYLSSYKYDQTIKCYQQLFGKEHVLVRPFEELIGTPATFWRELELFLQMPGLCEYMLPIADQIHDNASVGLGVHQLRSLGQGFTGSIARALVPKKIKELLFWRISGRTRAQLPDEYVQPLAELYRGCNQWIQKELNLNLEQYKYPL